MGKATNTFNKGIDQDSSINKYGNDSYYDAVDMRILSRGSLSTGALVNVPGNKGVIDFGRISRVVTQSVTIGDDLFLFTTGNKAYTLKVNPDKKFAGEDFTVTYMDETRKWLIINHEEIIDPPTGYEGVLLNNSTAEEDAEVLAESTWTNISDIYSDDNIISFIFSYYDDDNTMEFSETQGYTQSSGSVRSSYLYKVSDYADAIDDEDEVTATRILYDQRSFDKLNFDADYLSVVANTETTDLKKIYWANGIDPLRSIDPYISNSSKDSSKYDHIPNVEFGEIETSVLDGGGLSSGIIQYSYQYFTENGVASTFAPPGNTLKLAKYKYVGSDVDELVSKSVGISITGLDTNYSNVRIVAIFYSQYGVAPEVNVVAEAEYDDDGSIFVVDSGSYTDSVALSEYRAYSQTTISPKYIESKDNILFTANIKETTFDSDAIDEWDARSYGFDEYDGTAKVISSPVDPDGEYYEINTDGDLKTASSSSVWAKFVEDTDWGIPTTFACVNESNSIYTNDGALPVYAYNPNKVTSTISSAYVRDSVGKVYGGAGKNVEYWFDWFYKDSPIQGSSSGESNYERSYFNNKNLLYKKDIDDTVEINLTESQKNEVYRIGIKFFNDKGQSSFVKWMGDVRWPDEISRESIGIATSPSAIVLKVTINNFPDDDSITGYQIVRAERSTEDKSILTSGMATPLFKSTSTLDDGFHHPRFSPTKLGQIVYNSQDDEEQIDYPYIEFMSPETLFNSPDNTKYTDKKLLFNYVGLISSYSEVDDYGGVENVYTCNPHSTVLDDDELDLTSTTLCYSITESINTPNATSSEESYPISHSLSGSDVYSNATAQAEGRCSKCSGVVLSLDENLDLAYITAPTEYGEKMMMCQILNNVDISRYGGYSTFSKANTEYINFSEYTNISEDNAYCMYGDTYSNEMIAVRMYYYHYKDINYDLEDGDDGYSASNSRQQLFRMFGQSQIDLSCRNDDIISSYTKVTSIPDAKTRSSVSIGMIQETIAKGISLYPSCYDERIGDLYIYNNVYSQTGTSNIAFSKPLNWTEVSSSPNKIQSSDTKTNGETNDSWLNFLASNFIEVNSSYGDITNVILFKNKLLFFQPDAFGTLAVNDRSLISDNNEGSISLGTGGILSRYDYISYYSGLELPTDLIKTKSDVFYIDSKAKQIMSVSTPNDSISMKAGVDSIFYYKINDSDERRIGYDSEYGEVLYSMGDSTLVYNENTKTFVSRYSINPSIYISTPKALFSQYLDFDEYVTPRVYRHNIGEKGLWYKEMQDGIRSTSSVKLIINPNGGSVNTFDNIDLRTEVFEADKDYPDYKDLVLETANRIVFSNSYLPFTYVEAAPDGAFSSPSSAGFTRLARAWRVQIPQYQGTSNSNRFTDTHLIANIEFDNNADKLFKLHDVISIFR